MKEKVDNKLFEILVREHHRRLLAYASSLVSGRVIAEDLVQEAFLIAYKKLDTYDPTYNFGAWLRGIIRMKYLEHVRKTREICFDNEQLDALDQSHEHWDELESESGDTLKALGQCITKLPELMKTTLDMFYMKSKSGSEVATSLGCNEMTVRKRLQRARDRLGFCINETLSGWNTCSVTEEVSSTNEINESETIHLTKN